MPFEIGQRVFIEQSTGKVLEKTPDGSLARAVNLVSTISWIPTYGGQHPYPYAVRLEGNYFAGNNGEFSIQYTREHGSRLGLFYDRPSLDEIPN